MDLANVQLPPRSHANVAASRSNEGRAITAVVFVHNVLQRRSPQPAVTLCSIGRAAVAGLTWGSAPHPGSVARGGPFAPRRSLAGALCAPPLCGNENRTLVKRRITVWSARRRSSSALNLT